MRWILCALLLLVTSACAVRHPIRRVEVPARCEMLIGRAAAAGVSALSEEERAELRFCHDQLALRAAEEQAAAARDQGLAARNAYNVSLIVSAAGLVLSLLSLIQ